MIVLNKATKGKKTLLCPNCKKGKIGSISEKTKTSISKRGKPPPDYYDECVIVRCKICGSYTQLTIE